MIKSILKSKKGVTLIEVIVASGLVMMVLLSVFYFTSVNMRAYNMILKKNIVKYNAKQVVNKMNEHGINSCRAEKTESNGTLLIFFHMTDDNVKTVFKFENNSVHMGYSENTNIKEWTHVASDIEKLDVDIEGSKIEVVVIASSDDKEFKLKSIFRMRNSPS